MSLLKHILVPTDFSRNSGAAINYACDLAVDSKSTLHLLHVQNEIRDSRDAKRKSLERLNSVLSAHSELFVDTVKHVAPGPPSKAILDYARQHDVDLIVMGTHGRSGLAHLTMGSVTEKVVRDATCPIMVLGPHDSENVSLERVAEVVSRIVHGELDTNREVGRGQILKQMVEKLRIPATTAILMFDELEDHEWIQWHSGEWTTVEGTGSLEAESEPFVIETPSVSQAIELIERARKLRATDVHIDPVGEEKNVVRFRIDGQLKTYCRMQRDVADHLINQYKTLSQVDISDPFRPLEGRVRLPSTISNLQVRLTSVPVAEGQAVALRLFDPEKVFLPLDQLGMAEDGLANVKAMLEQEEGLVLVTGPTGAGKTTTVYSMLESLGGEHRNIVSIEDPVEFVAPFVRQLSVDSKHGLSITEGLRTIMRMDPDVIFVGEIRGPETAAMGMRASGSGKYVFSTMHTRDIASTITALRDLELTERSLATNLTGIINQRLVRRLCTHCQVANEASAKQKEVFVAAGLEAPEMLFEAGGCAACNGSGHGGRVGVFEVATMSDVLRDAIVGQESTKEIVEVLRELDHVDLQTDALLKAGSGLISFEEANGVRWLA